MSGRPTVKTPTFIDPSLFGSIISGHQSNRIPESRARQVTDRSRPVRCGCVTWIFLPVPPPCPSPASKEVWTQLWRDPSARWRDSGPNFRVRVYLGQGVLYSLPDCKLEQPGLQSQEGYGAISRFDLVDGVPSCGSGACRCADRAGSCSGRSPRTRPDPWCPPLQPDYRRELRPLYRLQPLHHEGYPDLLQARPEEEHSA